MDKRKISIEFDEDMMQAIEKRAKQKHTSVEGFILYCINDHIDTRKAVIQKLLRILPTVLAIWFSTMLVMWVVFFSKRC